MKREREKSIDLIEDFGSLERGDDGFGKATSSAACNEFFDVGGQTVEEAS